MDDETARPLAGRRYPILLTSVTFSFEGMAHVATIGSFAPLTRESLDPEGPCDFKMDWPKSLNIVEIEVDPPSVLLRGLGVLVVDRDPLPLTAQQVLKNAFDRVPGFNVVGAEPEHTGG